MHSSSSIKLALTYSSVGDSMPLINGQPALALRLYGAELPPAMPKPQELGRLPMYVERNAATLVLQANRTMQGCSAVSDISEVAGKGSVCSILRPQPI
jgi:hypothetical protein